MYTFSFKVVDFVPALNSTFFAGGFLILYSCINSGYRGIVQKYFHQKRIHYIFLFLFILFSYSLIVVFLKGTNDFSYVKIVVLQCMYLFIGVFLFSLYIYKNKEPFIVKHIIYVFIAQSLIQLVSLLSPDIKEFLNVFRNETTVQWAMLNNAAGFRGLAISGAAFFGLGVGYGVALILFLFNWREMFTRSAFLKILMIVLLLFGAILAARTSLLGLLIAAAVLSSDYMKQKLLSLINLPHLKIRYNIRIRLFSLAFIFTTTFATVIATNTIGKNQEFINKMTLLNRWAFQFYYYKQENDSFSTSSTNKLFDDMYFSISNNTIPFGDGRYTNSDGGYYMGTDAGYMRSILYFGIVGIIILLIYQLSFFVWNRKNRVSLQNICIIIYILVVHIKGDALGSNFVMQNTLLLLCMSNLQSEQNGKLRHAKLVCKKI